MTIENRHVCVCICTYKRPQLLKRLLEELECQRTEGQFTYSIVVADNDSAKSAEQVVSEFASRCAIPVTYCVEPQQNIALVRNRSLARATGEFIAIIDDDEYPAPDWLIHLLNTCDATGADGVLGPVIPYFELDPPKWLKKGRFFERANHHTGYSVRSSDLRTSNVIFKRAILHGTQVPFRPQFGTGGEDTDFFLRMMEKGCVFVWCKEALVYEVVPAARCTRLYLLRRALHRGNNTFKLRTGRINSLIKAIVALPVYGLALPFLLVAGEHHFLKYLIKFCDHTGLLLALLRIKPFKEYR